MTKAATQNMIAGRKTANWHRPANMPRTAVQIDGVWYRNHHEAAKRRAHGDH